MKSGEVPTSAVSPKRNLDPAPTREESNVNGLEEMTEVEGNRPEIATSDPNHQTQRERKQIG